MPVYEFLCPRCNRIYSFLSYRINTTKVPTCPKCGAEDLRRRTSRFGVGRKGASSPEGGGGGGEDDFDDPRMEREMMKLAAEMESMDENDPRQMAHAVRKMAELSGEPITPAMEEMVRRLEKGEDPEKVEEEMGDELEEEMGGDGGFGGAGAPDYDDGLYPM